MCDRAPHTFQDVFETEAESERARLLEDLRSAQQLLGDYELYEAGEAVMVYRMCTKTYRDEAEEKRVNRAIRHYWDGITARMLRGGAASTADDCVTFDHVLSHLTAVDRKVVEMTEAKSGEDGDQQLRAAFDAGVLLGEEALRRTFTSLEEDAAS